MALGAVETGIMNPMLAPSVAPSTGSIGRTPAACDTAIAIGTIMFADAVFDAASDTTIAAPVNSSVNANDDCDGSQLVTPSPTACAKPVENAISPRASPPPYNNVMPQSILAASSHVSVNRRSCQLTGSTNNRQAPIIAATPSGICAA